MQTFQSAVAFTCPSCGKAVRTTADVPEPSWGSSERSSDLTSEGPTSVACSHCLTSFDATVESSPCNCRVTLDDYPDTSVRADTAFYSPPEEDEWTDQDVPASPYDHFTDAYHHLGHLLAQVNDQGREIQIPDSSRDIMNRMVFTQQIAALEAYLGDTLRNGVLGSSASTRLLLEGDKVLKETSISLTAIAANPMIVRDTVAKRLSELIYHKLAQVDCLYKIAFGFSIWPNKNAADKLFVAVNWRHDCVHRNGKDKNGAALKGITREYVDDILDTALAMVVHIEGGLGRDRSRDWEIGQ